MSSSRLSRIRGKRDTTLGFVYIAIAILIIVAMISWGIPWMARMAGLLITEDNGTGGVSELAPTPPIFSDIPEATNSATIEVAGFAQPGIDVVLYVNGAEYDKNLTDDAGVFSFDKVNITRGENVIYAHAVSPKGGPSDQSRQYTIIYDNEKPEFTLSSPMDGEVFRGQSQRIINFQGIVNEEGVRVVIGERIAILQSDGSFSLPYQLQDGDQDVRIIVTDQAGNVNEQVIKLKWEQ